MLQTTVNYLSLLENKRHNLKTEEQGDIQLTINQGELEVHRGQLAETTRHNIETEKLGWSNLFETQRHNLATEQISAYDANTRRMHLDVDWFNANTSRYSAIQNAGIGWANVAIGQQNADTSYQRMLNDYEISKKQVSVAQQNADTATRNADIANEELNRKIQQNIFENKILERETRVKEAETEIKAFESEIDAAEFRRKMWETSLKTGMFFKNLIFSVSG